MWMFSKFASDCTTGQHRSISEISLDEKDDIANSCSQMMYGLHDVYDPDKVGTFISHSLYLSIQPFGFHLFHPVALLDRSRFG